MTAPGASEAKGERFIQQLVKKLLLCTTLALTLAATVQGQDEFDALLKKQDAPVATSTSASPRPASQTTPQARTSPPVDAVWKEYVNSRFGFGLNYPGELVAGQSAEDGSGAEFHTPDKAFSVVARGQYLKTADPNDSLTKRWQDELTALGSTVTYKRKAETWYVISGFSKAGTEYYHKFFVQGGNWTDFHVVYPHADARRYDPMVAEISKRFVPFLNGPFDRAK